MDFAASFGFGGSAYFIFGASVNASFNISYLNNELKNIFGGY